MNMILKNTVSNEVSDMSEEILEMTDDINEISVAVEDISNSDTPVDNCTGNNLGRSSDVAKKPVIYLYPEETEDVVVKLTTTNDGSNLFMTWPVPVACGNEYTWNVSADPDGTIKDADGNEYSYIFWEADKYGEADFSQGFCVRGEDTAEFLRQTLAGMGLTPKEYNEFIVYWTPIMQDNEYNLISFQGSSYDEMFHLDIVTADGDTPDSMLRVMMAWKALDGPVEIEPQEFEAFERKGFTVVEWGGTEVR